MEEMEEKGGSLPSLRSFEGPPYPEVSIPRFPLTPEDTNAQILIDAKNKYLLESHEPPIVWARNERGFRIQDMTARHYDDVNNLIMTYMPSDPLLKTVQDPECAGVYSSALTSWFPKTQSLVALKEGSKEVMGVLVGRLVVENDWFELLSEIEFVEKKDKYAYLKQGRSDGTDPGKSAKRGKSMSKKDGKRGSKVSKRQSKAGGSRKSMGAKGGGQRKSMGAKGGGQRKSMGAKGGQRKSMGAKGGQRKSMGAKGGQRKSMGSRKSMTGSRKSMTGSRKSMTGSRKSMTGSRKGKIGKSRSIERKKRDSRVSRPEDIIPEEVIPVVQAVVFDDDGVTFPNTELQYMQTFKRKLDERFRIWKLLKVKMYFRVYLVVVSPKYERFDIERALFVSLKHMCVAFNVQAIAGVLTKYPAQNAFYDVGALIVYEILYKHYPKFEQSDPKSYDKSMAVMFMEVPPAAPAPEPPATGRTSLTGKQKGK